MPVLIEETTSPASEPAEEPTALPVITRAQDYVYTVPIDQLPEWIRRTSFFDGARTYNNPQPDCSCGPCRSTLNRLLREGFLRHKDNPSPEAAGLSAAKTKLEKTKAELTGRLIRILKAQEQGIKRYCVHCGSRPKHGTGMIRIKTGQGREFWCADCLPGMASSIRPCDNCKAQCLSSILITVRVQRLTPPVSRKSALYNQGDRWRLAINETTHKICPDCNGRAISKRCACGKTIIRAGKGWKEHPEVGVANGNYRCHNCYVSGRYCESDGGNGFFWHFRDRKPTRAPESGHSEGKRTIATISRLPSLVTERLTQSLDEHTRNINLSTEDMEYDLPQSKERIKEILRGFHTDGKVVGKQEVPWHRQLSAIIGKELGTDFLKAFPAININWMNEVFNTFGNCHLKRTHTCGVSLYSNWEDGAEAFFNSGSCWWEEEGSSRALGRCSLEHWNGTAIRLHYTDSFNLCGRAFSIPYPGDTYLPEGNLILNPYGEDGRGSLEYFAAIVESLWGGYTFNIGVRGFNGYLNNVLCLYHARRPLNDKEIAYWKTREWREYVPLGTPWVKLDTSLRCGCNTLFV